MGVRNKVIFKEIKEKICWTKKFSSKFYIQTKPTVSILNLLKDQDYSATLY